VDELHASSSMVATAFVLACDAPPFFATPWWQRWAGRFRCAGGALADRGFAGKMDA
jgi:hypothetical protein